MEGVRDFLVKEGLMPTKVYPCGGPKPVWRLRLPEKGGLLVAAKKMLPLLTKKHGQIEAVIDYIGNRISGEELVERFNLSSMVGTRSGFIRTVKMPYTHLEGVLNARRIVAQGKHAFTILNKDLLREIAERRTRGETLREISFVYGISRSSIRRAFLRFQVMSRSV